MNNIKSPPIFHPEEDDDYTKWRNDIGVWKMFTDTKVEKLGPAVYLSLQGKARDAVRSLKIDDLGKEGGFDLILQELDNVYMQDETSRAFCAFKDFYEYSRGTGEGFSDFIVSFDQRYTKLRQYKMELPEGVQAFFLLKAANLNTETEKLARAISKLEYKDMREKLMKIFGDPGVLSDKNDVPAVKEDSVLYGENYDRDDQWGGRGASGRVSRGRGRGFVRGNNQRDSYRRGYSSTGRGSGPSQSNWRSSPARCFECDSTKHFAKDCPHRSAKKEDVEMNVHIALLSTNPRGTLLRETHGKMILDSGCSKTVAGKSWLEEINHTMSQADRESIVEKKSNSIFRFGDGVENSSLKVVTIPIYIGKLRILLDVEIVDKEIPLLLSRAAMKRLGMTIDFRRDHLTYSHGELKLECTTAGHYVVPVTVTHADSNNVNFVFNLECLAGLSRREKMTKALKIHRQFSHASKEKLTKLLKNGGCEDPEFLECLAECCEKCETCYKFKKPPLKPIVGFPGAAKFNELVCMDLKEHEHAKVWILHLIDAASRYSAACLIKSKRKEVVVAAIFRIWITYFGSPVKFLNDNGGEFANDVFREMNEKLGVITETTAAESPFSNGIVERHNGILYEAMMKTMKDTRCDADMALAWAVSAKNALQNSSGYSPNQLVFGQNTNMPTVLTDLPPALEATTSSEIVRRNLEALHAARKNFIAAESSERVRRALRHKVRTYADQHYETGQKVFYRREGFKSWKGPGTVIGVDNKTIVIRHGSAIYRCHPCHLMRVNTVECAHKPVTKSNEHQTTDSQQASPHSIVKSDKSVRWEENDDSDEEVPDPDTVPAEEAPENDDSDEEAPDPDTDPAEEEADAEHESRDHETAEYEARDDTVPNVNEDLPEQQSTSSEDKIPVVTISEHELELDVEEQTNEMPGAERHTNDDESDQVVTRPKPRSYVQYAFTDGKNVQSKNSVTATKANSTQWKLDECSYSRRR